MQLPVEEGKRNIFRLSKLVGTLFKTDCLNLKEKAEEKNECPSSGVKPFFSTLLKYTKPKSQKERLSLRREG